MCILAERIIVIKRVVVYQESCNLDIRLCGGHASVFNRDVIALVSYIILCETTVGGGTRKKRERRSVV